MSEVRLVVREAACDWSGTIHGSGADLALAALSADPVTLEELEAAVARFARPTPNRRFFASLERGGCAEPYDAGLVVIDLVARLVFADSTYSSPERSGTEWYHDGESRSDKPVRYHLADDWIFRGEGDSWEHVAAERRRERAAKPVLDARAVFYGTPLLEFIGRECFAAFARRDKIAAAARARSAGTARDRQADEAGLDTDAADLDPLTEPEITPTTRAGDARADSPFYDTIKAIHAAWMLTPRADLNGACPRDVGVERIDHLTCDLEDRCDQWSRLGECPPGLAKSAHAFQYGGFGTHELVTYYDLVRELLWSCWEHLASSKAGPLPDAFTVGDFLMTEVPRLATVRDAWLDAPDPEFEGRTPRSIIDRERARLPESVSSDEAMIDPDCPVCQMMGESSAPMFWHLDGSAMDDDFAFDICKRTREEWEEEQMAWDDFGDRLGAQEAERARLTETGPLTRDDGAGAVWSGSFSVAGAADAPMGVRLYGIGCHLAELIVGLRAGAQPEATPPAAQRRIDELNRDFGNLRDILQGSDSSLADALIEPVIERFTATLDTVATDRPELALKCESLTTDLHSLLNSSSSELDWGPGDPEVSL